MREDQRALPQPLAELLGPLLRQIRMRMQPEAAQRHPPHDDQTRVQLHRGGDAPAPAQLTGERTDQREPRVGAGQRKRRRELLTAHGVQQHVDALRRRPAQLPFDRPGAAHDRVVVPQLGAQQGRLALRAGAADDPAGTQAPRQLPGQAAHTARRAGDEHGVPRPYLRGPAQRPQAVAPCDRCAAGAGSASGSSRCTRDASTAANSRQPQECRTSSPGVKPSSGAATTSPTAEPHSASPGTNEPIGSGIPAICVRIAAVTAMTRLRTSTCPGSGFGTGASARVK